MEDLLALLGGMHPLVLCHCHLIGLPGNSLHILRLHPRLLWLVLLLLLLLWLWLLLLLLVRSWGHWSCHLTHHPRRRWLPNHLLLMLTHGLEHHLLLWLLLNHLVLLLLGLLCLLHGRGILRGVHGIHVGCHVPCRCCTIGHTRCQHLLVGSLLLYVGREGALRPLLLLHRLLGGRSLLLLLLLWLLLLDTWSPHLCRYSPAWLWLLLHHHRPSPWCRHILVLHMHSACCRCWHDRRDGHSSRTFHLLQYIIKKDTTTPQKTVNQQSR